jgi:hypothetical protein
MLGAARNTDALSTRRRGGTEESAMRMEIRDKATAPGYAVNEDALGDARFGDTAAAWVLDGATGLADQEVVPGAGSDAAWVAGRLSAHLAALDPGEEAPRAYFTRILERVAAEYQAAVPQHRELPAYVLPSAAGVWIRVRQARPGTTKPDTARLDIAWLGDCVGIIRHDGGLKLVGAIAESPWEDGINRVVAARQAAAPEDRPMLQVLSAELRARRARLNQPGGYWMLGVDPRAAAGLSQDGLDVTGTATVLLMSDGLWRLVDHFHRYDAGGLIKAALAKGLDGLIAELRDLERADPQGRAVPRVKPFDDATGLLLQVIA